MKKEIHPKAALRKKMLARRRAMAPEAVRAGSAAIAACLWQLSRFRRAGTLLTYVASKDNEVDTLPIIEQAITEGRRVMVPLSTSSGELRWSNLWNTEDLVPGLFGILEPRPEVRELALPPEQSICLVPGIAFNKKGQRLGYGGGFFDRFLAHYRGRTIGLAFGTQLLDVLPQEQHDQKVDWLVTEAAAWECAKETPSPVDQVH